LATTAAEELLRLQAEFGNRAVSRAVARYTNPRGGGASVPPHVAAAANANSPLEGAPMRTLHQLLGLRPEDRYSEFTYDELNNLLPPPATPGVVDEAVFNTLFPKGVTLGLHSQLAHLWLAIEGTDDVVLSWRYDAKLETPYEVLAEGALRQVRLGPSAFTSPGAFKSAMNDAYAPVSGGVAGNAPRRLNAQQLEKAVSRNSRFGLRAATAIQQAIAAKNNNPETEDFAEWIAAFQARSGLALTGFLDDATFAKVAEQLERAGMHASLLRLVVENYPLDRTWVSDISFDPDIKPRQFEIDRSRRGPVTIAFGPMAFVQGVAGLIHVVADAVTQAVAHTENQELFGPAPSLAVQQLLGKRQHFASIAHLPEESNAGLMAVLNDLLASWRTLSDDERWAHVTVMAEVLEAVEPRFETMGQTKAKQLRALRKEVERWTPSPRARSR
jgi:hypothetical protein